MRRLLYLVHLPQDRDLVKCLPLYLNHRPAVLHLVLRSVRADVVEATRDLQAFNRHSLVEMIGEVWAHQFEVGVQDMVGRQISPLRRRHPPLQVLSHIPLLQMGNLICFQIEAMIHLNKDLLHTRHSSDKTTISAVPQDEGDPNPRFRMTRDDQLVTLPAEYIAPSEIAIGIVVEVMIMIQDHLVAGLPEGGTIIEIIRNTKTRETTVQSPIQTHERLIRMTTEIAGRLVNPLIDVRARIRIQATLCKSDNGEAREMTTRAATIDGLHHPLPHLLISLQCNHRWMMRDAGVGESIETIEIEKLTGRIGIGIEIVIGIGEMEGLAVAITLETGV
jgi:hypothetical protein